MNARDGLRSLYLFTALALGCAHAEPTTTTTPTSVERADPSDPVAYTEAAAARLGAAIEGHSVTVGGELELVVDDRWVVSLARPFEECQRETEYCSGITGDYLASVAEMVSRSATEGTPTLANLRLALRPRSMLEVYAARGVTDVVFEPFMADLVAVVMVDFPESARTLLERELEGLGLDRPGAIAQARQNVIDELGPFAPSEIPTRGEPTLGISTGYYYSSSRLVAPETFEPVAQLLGGELLIAVPEYGVLLFAENAGVHAVLAMHGIAEDVVSESTQPLSSQVFVYREGRIELLAPSP